MDNSIEKTYKKVSEGIYNETMVKTIESESIISIANIEKNISSIDDLIARKMLEKERLIALKVKLEKIEITNVEEITK